MKLFNIAPLIAVAAALAACSGGGHGTVGALSGAGSATGAAAKPVAMVNGKPISRALFDYYARNAAGKPPAQLSSAERKQLLDNLVRGELIAQQAEKEGLADRGDTASLLALSRLQILEQAGASHYLKSRPPTDKEMQAEYARQVADLPKEQYHARHILVSTRAAAEKIILQLRHGANFAKLAKADSLDSTAKQGGDLGWFSTDTMVKPFADAVQSLKKGEITPKPVQTQYGWHVIQLLDTRPTPIPPFAQVKKRISQIVQTDKFRSYVDGLMKSAKIQTSL